MVWLHDDVTITCRPLYRMKRSAIASASGSWQSYRVPPSPMWAAVWLAAALATSPFQEQLKKLTFVSEARPKTTEERLGTTARRLSLSSQKPTRRMLQFGIMAETDASDVRGRVGTRGPPATFSPQPLRPAASARWLLPSEPNRYASFCRTFFGAQELDASRKGSRRQSTLRSRRRHRRIVGAPALSRRKHTTPITGTAAIAWSVTGAHAPPPGHPADSHHHRHVTAPLFPSRTRLPAHPRPGSLIQCFQC